MELTPPIRLRTGNEKILLLWDGGDGCLQLTLPVQKCGFAIRLFELVRPLYHMCQRELAFTPFVHVAIASAWLRWFAKGLRYRYALCLAPPNHRKRSDCAG